MRDETKTKDERFVPMTELTKRLGKSRAFIYAEAKRNPNFVRLVKLAGRVGVLNSNVENYLKNLPNLEQHTY